MTSCDTQTVRPLQMDNRAGLQKHSRTKAAASGFNLPNGTVRGMPFSLPQTGPTQGQNSGPFWNGESEQHFYQDTISPHVNAQNGFPDAFSPFHASQETQTGQDHGRGSFSGSSKGQWTTELSTEMSRHPSRDSIGAHSQGTTYSSAVNPFDQIRSTRMYHNDSQMSYVSPVRSDASDRSNSPVDIALCTPTQQDLQDLQDLENYTFQSGEELSGANPMYPRDFITGIATPADAPLTGPSYIYPASGEEMFVSMTIATDSLPSQGPVSRDSLSYNPSTMMDSPPWDSVDFLDSQRSSPTHLDDDPWALLPPQMMTSTTNSPLNYSPTLDGRSPRYVHQDHADLVEQPPYTTTGDRATRKPIGPRLSKVTSDLASRRPRIPGSSETSDESFKLVGRSSLDLDNTAREHPLYHNVTPKADGLYHCPFEDDPKANCTHKPEKLKCNYDKFVDSHLKPYKCKVHTCKELCFSSTACLLRHEREAHAMHGHGDKPFLCTYENCERGVPGNGFPRHWNLRDHMKRVHNDPGQPKSNASGSPPASGPVPKGKKRKAGDNPDAPLMEKSQKRNVSPPASNRLPQEPSLEERYHEKKQALMETITKLEDPMNPENMALLRNATDSLKVMAQITHHINSAPAMGRNFSQQSG